MNTHIGRYVHSAARAHAILCLAILCGLVGPAVQRSVAAVFTLANVNSVAQFETATQANNFNWTVEGVNQLAQQAFWYRIGNGGPEVSVNTLPIAVQGVTDSNFDGNADTLFVRYISNGVRVETRYQLQGGLPGSEASDMDERISITNLTDGPMDFHFFQYADFDLQGDPNGDSAAFTNLNTVQQYKSAARLTETVVTPVPSHRDIAFFPVTRNGLNDGVATTLSNTPIGTVVGPGNMTWAYQWDFVLLLGTTFQIIQDEHIGTLLRGDYNFNGAVDAADYVLWRKNPNTFGGDPTGYNTWRANFGQTAGNGSGASANSAVPEPTIALMFLTGVLVMCAHHRAIVSKLIRG
jgi:hypothetical protein